MGASTNAWNAIYKALENGAEIAAEDGYGEAAEDLAFKMTYGEKNPTAVEAALADKLKGLAYEIDNALAEASTALLSAAKRQKVAA